jgi:hypothetical protein
MINLVCIPPTDVWKIWPGVSGLIDAGYAASDVPMPNDILDQLRSGTMLLWLAVDEEGQITAAMLTQLFEMRTGKMCKMMECGGDRLREWKHLRAEIEQYAKREGCDRVLVEGRPGWARVLTDYTTIAVVLEKRI